MHEQSQSAADGVRNWGGRRCEESNFNSSHVRMSLLAQAMADTIAGMKLLFREEGLLNLLPNRDHCTYVDDIDTLLVRTTMSWNDVAVTLRGFSVESGTCGIVILLEPLCRMFW